MHSGKENTDQDLTKNQHLPEDEQEDGQLQTKGKKLNKRLRLYQNSYTNDELEMHIRLGCQIGWY